MQKTRFPTSTAKSEGMSDKEVVVQVLTGETALFEIIMRRYNQRVYGATRENLKYLPHLLKIGPILATRESDTLN